MQVSKTALNEMEARLTERIDSGLGRIENQLKTLNGKVAKHEARLNDFDINRARRSVDCPNIPTINILKADNEKHKHFEEFTEKQTKKLQITMALIAGGMALILNFNNVLNLFKAI